MNWRNYCEEKIIALTVIFVMLLLCFGCDRANQYENSLMKVHLPYKPETAIGLSDEAVDFMATLLKDAQWEEGITKTVYDYVLLYDNTSIRYVPAHGLFNDVDNNRHCYISESEREYVNSLLGSYFD